MHMFMRHCEKIYRTTSKVKPKRYFFSCSTKLSDLQKNCKSNASCSFLLPQSFHCFSSFFLFSYSLFCFSLSFFFLHFFEILIFFLSRGMNDRKFIVQTRCDDNESVSGAELGNCA